MSKEDDRCSVLRSLMLLCITCVAHLCIYFALLALWWSQFLVYSTVKQERNFEKSGENTMQMQ
jgi:hypothetical protein